MLPKKLRLNLRSEFRNIVKGKKIESPNFKLYYVKNAGIKVPTRIGVSVGKQQFKKAHLRNEAKRKAYFAVSGILEELPEGLNLIIMPKAGILEISAEALSEELKKALIK